MYRLQSVAIMAGLVAIFAFFTYLFLGWTGPLLVLGLGVGINLFSLEGTRRLILRLHRARRLEQWEAPQLHDVARRLAAKAGIETPQLMIYPVDMPNAFALGIGDGVVAVSTGLLQLLNGREVAGVLAHEVAHLKNRDSLLSLSGGLFVQSINLLSQGFALLALLLALTGQVGDGIWPLLVLLWTAPTVALLLQAGLMRTRERLADRDAALLTGDPRGLAAALYRLQQYSRYIAGLMRRFRFIYTSEEESGSRWLRTHPSTEERVRALLEMEDKVKPLGERAPGRPSSAPVRIPVRVAV